MTDKLDRKRSWMQKLKDFVGSSTPSETNQPAEVNLLNADSPLRNATIPGDVAVIPTVTPMTLCNIGPVSAGNARNSIPGSPAVRTGPDRVSVRASSSTVPVSASSLTLPVSVPASSSTAPVPAPKPTVPVSARAPKPTMPVSTTTSAPQTAPNPRSRMLKSLKSRSNATTQGQDYSFPRAPLPLPDTLYDHQHGGVQWMMNLYKNRTGGILADDMGLGKTVQVCAFLAAIRARCVLMIMPVSLIGNWQQEMAKWYPGVRVSVMHGSKSRQEKAKNMGSSGVVLTSYETFWQCVDEMHQFTVTEGLPEKKKKVDDDEIDAWVDPFEDEPLAIGTTMPWDVVVFDEAHRLKNPGTHVGKAAHKIQARSRIALSGTPIQNNLEDLWSVMDVCVPGILGNLARFRLSFVGPIDRGSLRSATTREVELKNVLAEQLRDLIRPYLMRRVKDDINLLGDVKKTEVVLWVRPSKIQTDIYKRVLKQSADIKSIETNADVKMGLEVFRAVNLLKKVCNTPMLAHPNAHNWAELVGNCALPEDVQYEVEDSAADGDPLAEVPSSKEADEMIRMMIAGLKTKKDDLIAQSSKLQVLTDLVPGLVSKGHRLVIFSASTKMCDLITVTVLKPQGLSFLRIDGSYSQESREKKINAFQNNPKWTVFLSSTQVGGVGLTLTGADRVVIVDPAWNPATDAQAVDRIYRIGQTRDVVAYRLICSGMIEEKMFRLQVYKMSITNAALGTTSKCIRYFSKNDIRALFTLDPPDLLATKRRMEEKDGLDDRVSQVFSAEFPNIPNRPWYMGFSDFTQLFSSLDDEVEEEQSDDQTDIKELLEELGQKSAEATEAREKKQQQADKMKKKVDDADRMKEELHCQRRRAVGQLEALKQDGRDKKRELSELVDTLKGSERAVQQVERKLEQANKHIERHMEQWNQVKDKLKDANLKHVECEKAIRFYCLDQNLPQERGRKAACTAFKKAVEKGEASMERFAGTPSDRTREAMRIAYERIRFAVETLNIKGLSKAEEGLSKSQNRYSDVKLKYAELDKNILEDRVMIADLKEERQKCMEQHSQGELAVALAKHRYNDLEEEITSTEASIERIKEKEQSRKAEAAYLKGAFADQKKTLNGFIKQEREAVKERKKGEDEMDTLKRKHAEIEDAKIRNLKELKAESYDAAQVERMFNKKQKK